MSDFSDLLDQLKADFSSKEDRESAIKERDKLMSDMEFQNRAQHQMAKEFPAYSQTYGNRAIYNPKQDLSGMFDNPEVKPIIDQLKQDPSLENLHRQSFGLRDTGQRLAAEALGSDKLKTKNPVEFINKLKDQDKLDYNIGVAPDLQDVKGWSGAYTEDPDDPKKKIILMDKGAQDDLGVWLHEHLHALNDQTKKNPESQTEKLDWFLNNPKERSRRVQEAIDNKDVNALRQMLSGGHFMAKPNTLPELYVQDQFENEMKNRGFETRKDPIKSRFERLKQLMRY